MTSETKEIVSLPPIWAIYTSMQTPFMAVTSVFFTTDPERVKDHRDTGSTVREASWSLRK